MSLIEYAQLVFWMVVRFLPLLFCLLLTGCRQGNSGLTQPVKLTCEYLNNPAVVDVLKPRLSWVNQASSAPHGQQQTAYQIRVASTADNLSHPDMWDSGKVRSWQSTRIPYNGVALTSRQECYWQVRVWDKDSVASEWSEPGFWRMGLLNESDWSAHWIGAPWQGEAPLPKPTGPPDARPTDYGPPAPMLRKKFAINKPITKAVVFVTGLGYFELRVNGQKVSEDVLVPNQTNYGKRPAIESAYINLPDNFRKYKVMYLAYDIDDLLSTGTNVMGVLLGNGFYNPAKFWCEGYGTPRLLLQLHLTFDDGSEEIISTDESWKVAHSPIVRNMVYYGEVYDARQEQAGWDTPAFDDSGWQTAAIKEKPFGDLVAHTANPDRVMERLKPESITRLGAGHYRVEFSKEISGWVKLLGIDGPEGQAVDITFNSNLYSGENTYICSGRGPAEYAPRFNWFVFSGVEIRNWPGELNDDDLVAESVHTYIETIAEFETSDTLINRIYEIWKQSQTDNMHGGIASDCPHRERSGYTGDGQVACPTVMHTYDARNFYHKWVQDMLDAQDINTGYVPNGAPWQPGCGGGVAWGAAICIIPWEFYLTYGDRDMLEDNYEGMKEYVRYMQTWVDAEGIMHSKRKNISGEILKWFNLGEWVAPGPTVPDELVHTFYFWYCADITSRVAGILGRPEEATTYETLAAKSKNAFHSRFYDPASHSYGAGGGNIFALRMGVPEDIHQEVVNSVREDLRATDGHLDTGIFGTRFFFEVLADHGLNELAYEAITKTTEPSFGHWVKLGSTTTREQWNEEGSHNHPMFGGGLIWLFKNLAGMRTVEKAPGYRHIVFKPQPVEGLSRVKYAMETAYGRAGIEWTHQADSLAMQVTVPVGSQASVYVPLMKGRTVSLVGYYKAEYVQEEGVGNGYSTFTVQSGQYRFIAK
jgi:alpha-L-rhamnosidase